ncbi:MAG: acyl-phosphate glycerol 3-phosphate acyltransferase [Gammaproteobacteria bacterium]|nr:MAG: acyl-phosphate glycerol 3-phosphate acyltransferase [Gammaproteobacteria bacterium]RKZ95732.1 MAG: acyl-phosphate glycerol 3-phosphate acyltransferase [Gammaproteobacteria bacterium]RKZ97551.1 MAG: acyl-phosphate glycerol 3-phosphate acyltransferase [Gammaproteobacteria bacterium]RLA02100.1 MAG: acyl-phosphate glycerol 3-phosphate acyltransferase [Gammaproteobacteria bacterium]HHA19307.1 glycerol-3-phosphate 1-O-acyltransferase [Methylophaga sp.]
MLETIALPLIVIVGAYLIGSLSSAIILCKLAGLPDPRTQGSGNPGATNVLRFGGKKLAATVLIIDVIKGILPVVIARLLDLDTTWLAATAFAAFLGHLYPIFFDFKGGKGVATALGGLLALSPPLAGCILLTWLVVFAISRISSLSAITAAALTPFYSLWMIDSINARWIVFVMAVMLLVRHQSNIKRLLSGEEGQSK